MLGRPALCHLRVAGTVSSERAAWAPWLQPPHSLPPETTLRISLSGSASGQWGPAGRIQSSTRTSETPLQGPSLCPAPPAPTPPTGEMTGPEGEVRADELGHGLRGPRRAPWTSCPLVPGVITALGLRRPEGSRALRQARSRGHAARGARSPAGLPAAYHSGWAAEPTFCHLSTPFLILSLPNLGGNYGF